MRVSTSTLLQSYQVRKTKGDKQAFTTYLQQHAKEYGYTLQYDEHKGNTRNLVVGNPETAKLFLTAHYDTPPNALLPILVAFGNWFSFFASMLLLVFLLGAVGGLLAWLLRMQGDFLFAPLAVPLLLLVYALQMGYGFANQHTANDNTSGVATLLALLEELPEEERKRLCFVFFDKEELGLVGSHKFYKRYQSTIKEKPLINFDCVGDGKTLVFVAKRAFEKSPYMPLLQSAAAACSIQWSKKPVFLKALFAPYPSDQLHFKYGVGVVAAHWLPLFGYHIRNIHSGLDKRLDEENIEALKDIVCHMVQQMKFYDDVIE